MIIFLIRFFIVCYQQNLASYQFFFHPPHFIHKTGSLWILSLSLKEVFVLLSYFHKFLIFYEHSLELVLLQISLLQIKKMIKTPEFPPKKVLKWSSKVLEQRRLALETYLQVQLTFLSKGRLSILQIICADSMSMNTRHKTIVLVPNLHKVHSVTTCFHMCASITIIWKYRICL